MPSLGAAPRAAAPPINARAEASRRNGAKSRGPKTPEGKARAAQNALKHGFRAQKYVVLPDEDADAFQALEAALMEELAPQGALQTVLARRIVAAAWRLERAERLEAELFAENHFEGGGLGLALIRDCRRSRAFDTLVRYRGGTLAEFWRALRTLKALQAEAAAPRAGTRLPAAAERPNEPKCRANAGDFDRPGAARRDDPRAGGLLPGPLPAAEPAPYAMAKGSASLLAGTALVPATPGRVAGPPLALALE